jgi:hypothetical protein
MYVIFEFIPLFERLASCEAFRDPLFFACLELCFIIKQY